MKHNLNFTELLMASRPISWPNTSVPFIVGYLLTGGSWNYTAIIAVLFFVFPYNLLMYGINDVFDYESDLKNPRKGGIEGGLLTAHKNRQLLYWSLIIPAPFILFFLSQTTGLTLLWFIFLISMVVAYSAPRLRFKERPFIDSFTSSTHFFSPFVFALLLGSGRIDFIFATVAFMLWGIASHALGAVQDIKSDTSANIKSVATEIGAQPTLILSFACYVAAVIITEAAYGILAGILLLPYALNVARYYRITETSSEKVHGAWKLFLRLNIYVGFMLTQLFIKSYNSSTVDDGTIQGLTSLLLIAGGGFGLWWLLKNVSMKHTFFLKHY